MSSFQKKKMEKSNWKTFNIAILYGANINPGSRRIVMTESVIGAGALAGDGALLKYEGIIQMPKIKLSLT